MGVQTLDADARAPDAATRLRAVGAHRGAATALGVLLVRRGQRVGVDEVFEAVDAPGALESTHGVVEFRVDQPEERRHRRAVAQVRFVLDDDRASVDCAARRRRSVPRAVDRDRAQRRRGRRATRRGSSTPELEGAHEARNECLRGGTSDASPRSSTTPPVTRPTTARRAAGVRGRRCSGSTLFGPVPGSTWIRLWPGETSWYCSRASRIAADLESIDLAWSREGALLTLDRVDLRGRGVEFTLLVPDRGRGEPTDEHRDGRHDGEGHHPVVAITRYGFICKLTPAAPDKDVAPRKRA